jgi:hypothetical protein
MRVEKELLKAVQHELPNGITLTLRDRVGGLFIIAIMQSPMRVKVPASASMVLPDLGADFSKIVKYWDEVRDKLGDLLQLRRGLFRHPVSGWIDNVYGLILSFRRTCDTIVTSLNACS